MVIQVVQEIDGSIEVVEETTTCSECQPLRFNPKFNQFMQNIRKSQRQQSNRIGRGVTTEGTENHIRPT